jgi:hypothetical protein
VREPRIIHLPEKGKPLEPDEFAPAKVLSRE